MRISDWSSDVCSSDLLRERKCLIWLAIALHDFVQPRHHPAHDCSPVARAAIRAAASVSPSYSSALSVSALRRDTSHGLFAPWLSGPYTSTDMRSEEHTSELQSLMRISYAVFCLKKKTKDENPQTH